MKFIFALATMAIALAGCQTDVEVAQQPIQYEPNVAFTDIARRTLHDVPKEVSSVECFPRMHSEDGTTQRCKVTLRGTDGSSRAFDTDTLLYSAAGAEVWPARFAYKVDAQDGEVRQVSISADKNAITQDGARELFASLVSEMLNVLMLQAQANDTSGASESAGAAATWADVAK
jgi:hypothetical protein